MKISLSKILPAIALSLCLSACSASDEPAAAGSPVLADSIPAETAPQESSSEETPPEESLSRDSSPESSFEESSSEETSAEIRADFQVGPVAVTIQALLPEGWESIPEDVDEGSPDWGIRILAEGKEEALIAIRGQYGTLDVSGLYPGPPETFLTDQGREAQYYKQEYASDQGEVFTDRYLVFGQLDSGFYGVSIQMPRSVFDRNEEAIQTLLKSIRITEE